MIKGAQGGFSLRDIPLEKMELTDSKLADVAYLTNLYPAQHYRLDALEADAWTVEFHTMDQQIDKFHMMTICFGR